MATTHAIEITKMESNQSTVLSQSDAMMVIPPAGEDDCCCEAMPCMPTCMTGCQGEEEVIKEEVPPEVIDTMHEIGEIAQPEIDAIIEDIIPDVVDETGDAQEAADIINEVIKPIVTDEVIEDAIE